MLNDGSALTNATIVAPVRPPSSTRIRARRWSGTKTPGTARAAPVDVTPGDLLHANASHPVEPRLSRLSLLVRDMCDGKALPPIQEFLAPMIGVRAPRSRAHLFIIMRLYSTA